MMTYDSLLNDALNNIPEFAAEYSKMVEKGYFDHETGNHIIFSWAFVPILANAINEKNDRLVRKIFTFVESMASSNDNRIQEVCDFTILEELYDQFPISKLLPLLGENTRKGYLAISEYMLPN